jgi:hypothetical protein
MQKLESSLFMVLLVHQSQCDLGLITFMSADIQSLYRFCLAMEQSLAISTL